MNIIIERGRLVSDPEIRATEQGLSIARFRMAVDRMKKEDGADFIPCVAFGKTAETIEKWFRKGNMITISGRVQTGSYTTKDGEKRATWEVVVERFDFEKAAATSAPAARATGTGDDFVKVPDDVTDDELPFN